MPEKTMPKLTTSWKQHFILICTHTRLTTGCDANVNFGADKWVRNQFSVHLKNMQIGLPIVSCFLISRFVLQGRRNDNVHIFCVVLSHLLIVPMSNLCSLLRRGKSRWIVGKNIKTKNTNPHIPAGYSMHHSTILPHADPACCIASRIVYRIDRACYWAVWASAGSTKSQISKLLTQHVSEVANRCFGFWVSDCDWMRTQSVTLLLLLSLQPVSSTSRLLPYLVPPLRR